MIQPTQEWSRTTDPPPPPKAPVPPECWKVSWGLSDLYEWWHRDQKKTPLEVMMKTLPEEGQMQGPQPPPYRPSGPIELPTMNIKYGGYSLTLPMTKFEFVSLKPMERASILSQVLRDTK